MSIEIPITARVVGSNRGFFFNRPAAEINPTTYRFQDPATLAVIGILITLATTALTLVRGR